MISTRRSAPRGMARWLAFGLALGWVLQCCPAEALTDAEFTEVLPILQSHLPNQSSLQDHNLTAESLTPLLPALGASVSADPLRSPEVEPLRTELLPGQLTYWRLASYRSAKGDESTVSLEESLNGKSRGLILDLRDTQAPNDFEGAAHVASSLVPSETVLFALQGVQSPQQVFQSDQQKKPFPHPIVILINRGTVGSAEALAAALKRSAKAILVGRTTLAEGGSFAEFKLKSGRYLRLMSSIATLPDGTNLGTQPLQPDIPVFVDDQQESEALAQIRLGSAARGLIEEGHKRLSEAALVRQEDPELDDIFKQNGKKKEVKPVQDPVLMRGTDILNAISAIFPSP